MKKSFLTSAGLHIAVFLALVLGLPHLKQPPLELSEPIPIDITDLGPVTTTTKVAQSNQAKATETPPPPKATPPKQEEPPKPKPAPPSPKDKPPEKPPEDDGPTVKDTQKPKPPKKEVKKEPPKENLENFSKLVNLLAQQTPPAPDSPPDAQPTDTPSALGSQGIVSDKLTITQEDLLKKQIAQCWNVPVGGRDVGNMIVELRIEVNPDRTVKEVVIVDQARMSDGFFRALAESAVRAVKNTRCSPLELPEDKYELWKEISFRFDPKQMLGM